jgi:glycosyltransferase involved in cell wall biosynthesis
MPKSSVIIATYNWPEALKLCLDSLRNQSTNDFEILIADDGSKPPTKELVDREKITFPVPIYHFWHEDDGCRKTIICNQAMRSAKSEYLIFIDGDCIVQPDFVEQHLKLAQKGYMVTGSRILLNPEITQTFLKLGRWDFNQFKLKALLYRVVGKINKVLPIFIKRGDGAWRNYKKFIWRRIKGCNMACWYSDAMAIQGYDETLLGWSHEDADFVFRLQNNGVIRKSGSWATEVLHLFHKVRDQSNNDESVKRLQEKILLASKNSAKPI